MNDSEFEQENEVQKITCDHHIETDSVYTRWEYGNERYFALLHCKECHTYEEHRIDYDDYLYWRNRL